MLHFRLFLLIALTRRAEMKQFLLFAPATLFFRGPRTLRKSFTTNATSEQKHQSLLEIEILLCGILAFISIIVMSTTAEKMKLFINFYMHADGMFAEVLIDIRALNNRFWLFRVHARFLHCCPPDFSDARREICIKHNYRATLKHIKSE